MLFQLRDLLASSLIHPLEGMTAGEWLAVLRREGFRVHPLFWPRAAFISALSLGNSVAARTALRRFGPRVEAARVDRPVFILGHYRSGTTHLHEMLALDGRFASPDRFQAFNPRAFLATEAWLKPLVEPFMIPRRVQEDEVALMSLTGLSPYLDWVFPRSRRGYEGTLRLLDPAERAAWLDALAWFLKALTVRHDRPIVLKSPPHTARVGAILGRFPDARFVHIRRDPYAVFASTVGLLRAVRPVFRLQVGLKEVDVDALLRSYRAMYDAYFADRPLIPPGQLVEVAFEDVEADPVAQLRAIYEGLDLAPFEPFRPTLEAYLATIAGHRKGQYPVIDEATRRKIAAACAPCFDAWGYPR